MNLKIKGLPVKVDNAILAVVSARAVWETVNEADQATKSEILRNNVFCEEESGERITEVSADFLMSDTDFTRYCEMVYARNRDKGFDSGEAGLNFWPLHKAVYDSEDALIDTITADIPDYTPEIVKTFKTNPKRRTEFLAVIGL